MTNLKDCWVQTYTGKQFFPLNPDVNSICIEDIANSLGKICRFNGHTTRFYSVAEHCLHISFCASKENALWGLLHDATEAYLIDMPRPLRPVLNGYKQIEERLCRCIATKFNLSWPIPEEIKKLDTQILHDESNQVMSVKPKAWPQLIYPPLGIQIIGMEWREVTARFLERYEQLQKELL